MHGIKRQARNVAWTDGRNPFAKRTASGRKITDPHSRAEKGDGSALFRPSTVPKDHAHNQTWDSADHTTRQNMTDPNAVSRRRNNEPGDHIGEVPQVSSPSLSARDAPANSSSQPAYDEKSVEEKYESNRFDTDKTLYYPDGSRIDSEKTLSPEKEEKEKKHRGLKGFLHGSDSDKKEEADDNNGKTKKKHNFTFMSQLRATLFNSWINVLLIASPIGFALHYSHSNDIAIFVVNFIAIIPLAAMLSYATEEIALRTGEVIGGLLNASFGNAVELIVSIIALVQDQILIVQTSLIGSMLSNLLLVMGMCFFAGGVNRVEQAFNMTVAQTAASLLFLAVSSLLIPTVFNEWANTGNDKTSSETPQVAGEAQLSRATAILLLIVYACYLFFQLKSHAKMYNAPSEKNEKRDFSKQKRRMKNIVGKARRRSLDAAHSDTSSQNDQKDGEEEGEEPQLHIWVALLTLGISTVLVAFNAEFLVDSINAITCTGGLSKNFVGLILLPIVGNAAEHATAVTVAIKDKMDLAIGVAVGSSMQIALLVLPLIVVLGWILGKDNMTLYFDGFQIAVLFVAVLLVNYLIQDGKSHWLEGVLLMILYIIIAVAAWFYPTAPGLNDCPAA